MFMYEKIQIRGVSKTNNDNKRFVFSHFQQIKNNSQSISFHMNKQILAKCMAKNTQLR